MREYFDDSSDSEFLNQQVFSDPLLDNSVVVLSFFKDDESAPTIDGIYGVELHYEGSLISDIFFPNGIRALIVSLELSSRDKSIIFDPI